MLALDVQTIAAMYVAASAAMTVCVAVSFAGAFRRGADKFFWYQLLQTVAWTLFCLRGAVPDALSVMAGNILATLSLGCFLLGVFEFFEKRMPRWIFCVPPALIALMFVFTDAPRAPRLVFTGMLLGGLHLLAALVLTMVRKNMRRRSIIMLTVAQSVMFALYAARSIIVALDSGAIPHIFHNSPTQSLIFSIGFVAMLLSSVAFILMHRERSEQDLRLQATMDPLTGAFNRRVFETLAQKAIARAARENSAIYLLLMDLDHFKRINDLHGHAVGDLVLKEFATRAQSILRTQDILARVGGEEFAVLLVNAHHSKASVVADRLRLSMYRAPVRPSPRHGGPAAAALPPQGVRVTVSLGVAGGLGEKSLHSLMERADKAMYLAKSMGRNQVRHEMELENAGGLDSLDAPDMHKTTPGTSIPTPAEAHHAASMSAATPHATPEDPAA